MIGKGKKVYLCRPDRSIITELNGIQIDTANYSTHVKDYDELSFTVDEYIIINGKKVKTSGYDLLDVYLNLYLEDIGYFQMQHPSTSNDGTKETKTITAYSLEKEWEQHDWQGLKVNTGAEDSLEQLAENNLNELGLAKEFVVFYRPDKTDLSLVHLMLEKMPGWSVSDDDIDPLLWNKKMRIEEDNINMYALATSVIAPRLECIIYFDTITKHIKAVSKDRLNDYTYNTNIFIGYRNLANAVDISVNEDSVYTRFSCKGDDDLDFRDINYGDNHVYNYSYFMRSPYMRAAESYLADEGLNPLSDEWNTALVEVEGIIPKLEYWMSWRDENRDSYIALSKSRANINDLIYDVQYRVPNDGTDWSQWDNMAVDLLQQNQRYYNAQLTLFQLSVDPDPQYDEDNNYIPWKKQDGTVDHELYMEKLYNLENWYGGYYTYYEIITYILPNIQIAIDNAGQAEKKDYNKEYLTDWELYGIKELEAKQKEYNEELTSLAKYSKPWNQMTAEEKAAFGNDEDMYNANGRLRYVKVSGYLGTPTTPDTLLYQLRVLNEELSGLNSKLNNIDNQRSEMIEKAKITNEYWGFTEQELIIVDTLTHDTDYVNNNILTTSVDTTITRLDREVELYNDSEDKLSEVCQPQFNFSVALDNLLGIPEFKGWVEDFKLLNFFRLGIRDDYSVKLRMVGYSYNPCDIDANITIDFSSMITSRSGRSDLTDLLNSSNNRGSKNSITIGTGNSDSDREYVTSLLEVLTKSPIFQRSVTDIAGNVAIGNTTIDPDLLQGLVNGYIKASEIDVDQITGNIANFMEIHSEYIDSDVVVGRSASFQELDADFANLMSAVVGTSSTETGIVFNLNASNASIDNQYVASLVAGRISVGDLATHRATSQEIVLISPDGVNPSIAFKGSTQQFYDVNGNVRVQIGQDGNGDFNFIVRSSDGQTALFDYNGITRDGIPSNTIINNMLADSTIQKTKLAFSVLEPNAQGGIDITNIYDGAGGKFGEQYTSFKSNTEASITELNRTVAALSDTAQSVELTGDQIFVQDTSGVISPSTITITATTYNNLQIGKWYIDGVENTSYISSDKKTMTLPSSAITGKKTLTIRVEGTDTTKFDVFTIYRIEDGADGADGQSGQDAYTAVISSSNGNIFKADSGVTQSQVTCTLYKGTQVIQANSYTWYYNTGGTDQLLGTGNPITLPLNSSVVRKSLYCVCDV